MDYSEILALRTKHKISQIKLAEHSGYSSAMVSGWELGKSEPSLEQLQLLSATISSILKNEEERGINIRKKRFQHSCKAKGNAPQQIMTAGDYKARMEKVRYPATAYTDTLNKMCCGESAGNKPKVVALFSGCGGMTLGFEWAGFDVVGHIDIDDAANEIYAANFPRSTLLGTDITRITEKDVREWKKRVGDIDVIIGGPPCQGFSLAGKRKADDERNELFQHYIKIVGIVRPKIFIMENVRLMTSMKDQNGRLFIDRILQGCRDIGYTVDTCFANAQAYGVPQFRARVVIIGIDAGKVSKEYVFPTYSDPLRTFRAAVSDLPALESGEKTDDPLHWTIAHPSHIIEWLRDVPEGKSAHENKNPALRPPSGFNTTYKRLRWDEPCSTISTSFNMISGCRNVHPASTRSLTIREAARAQSFPDSFAFFGKWGDIRRVIGNAVPPLLAKIIAESIKTILIQS